MRFAVYCAIAFSTAVKASQSASSEELDDAHMSLSQVDSNFLVTPLDSASGLSQYMVEENGPSCHAQSTMVEQGGIAKDGMLTSIKKGVKSTGKAVG